MNIRYLLVLKTLIPPRYEIEPLSPGETTQLRNDLAPIVDEFYGSQIRYSVTELLTQRLGAITFANYYPLPVNFMGFADTQAYVEHALRQYIQSLHSTNANDFTVFLSYEQFLDALTVAPTDPGSLTTSEELRAALTPLADALYGSPLFPQRSAADLGRMLERNEASEDDSTKVLELVNGNSYSIPLPFAIGGASGSTQPQVQTNTEAVLEVLDTAEEMSYEEFLNLLISNTTVTDPRRLTANEVVALRAYLGQRLERW